VYALTPGFRPSFGLRQICCADFAYTILAAAFLHGVASVAAVSVGFQRVPGPALHALRALGIADPAPRFLAQGIGTALK